MWPTTPTTGTELRIKRSALNFITGASVALEKEPTHWSGISFGREIGR